MTISDLFRRPCFSVPAKAQAVPDKDIAELMEKFARTRRQAVMDELWARRQPKVRAVR